MFLYSANRGVRSGGYLRKAKIRDENRDGGMGGAGANMKSQKLTLERSHLCAPPRTGLVRREKSSNMENGLTVLEVRNGGRNSLWRRLSTSNSSRRVQETRKRAVDVGEESVRGKRGCHAREGRRGIHSGLPFKFARRQLIQIAKRPLS